MTVADCLRKTGLKKLDLVVAKSQGDDRKIVICETAFTEQFTGYVSDEAKISDDTNFLSEIKEAVAKGRVAKDIALEQEKVKSADLVIFQFPLAWLSFPAILKGWMDRVMCNGFAFITEMGRLFDNGLLKVSIKTTIIYRLC